MKPVSRLVRRYLPILNFAKLLSRTSSFLLTLMFLPLVSPAAMYGQAGGASISGRLSDKSGAIVQDVDLSIKNVATGVTATTSSNSDGVYSFVSLSPGSYVISVQKKGFRSVDLVGLTIYTNDNLERNFTLEVGSVSESVTVQGGTTNTSPAVSMTVSREFVENMPLNGRSFQDLIQLAPGTVSTQTGYYVIDGQRDDSNNYVVDGVSANLGGSLNYPSGIGAGLSGSAPSQTILGTTQSLASIDSLQEFKIQTSGYTAEYGRNPGGQVQFTTRSGTNKAHGTAFDYLRNTVFDANSYLNDFDDDPKTAEHQNDFGGTVGGPIIVPRLYDGKDKSFYFLSYEALRLLLPSTEKEYVPTPAFRSWAAPGVQPFLDYKPLPNPTAVGNGDGCTIPDPTTGVATACDAIFADAYSYPEKLDNLNIRIDQNLGDRVHAFLRYADTPSSEATGLEALDTSRINTHGWTTGITANLRSNMVGDFRLNFSHDGEYGAVTTRTVNGSTPISRSLLIPSAYDNQYADGAALISVTGTDLSDTATLSAAGSEVHQYQTLGSVSWI